MNETTEHPFLISPGNWLGQGTIRVSEADEVLRFYSRWAIAHGEDVIQCTQTVEMEGGADHVINHLTFSEMENGKFHIDLENAMLGEVEGEGLIDEMTLGWEFRHSEQGFEGFEIYERQENDEYKLKAEYISSDGTRTMIEGKLWAEVEGE